MYQNLAILAAFLLLYSVIAGRIDRSWISGPIVFCAAGMVLGPGGTGALQLGIATEGLRLLAEATLAMVLFTDAAHADLRVIRRSIGVPERLLLIGLPLTILLGTAIAWILFPGLRFLEVALLATMLAPTDAALGKPVVASSAVPAMIRESLNLESGLNDGICVPLIVILLGLAVGTQMEQQPATHVAIIVTEAIGIGLLVGLALAALAAWVFGVAAARGWSNAAWRSVEPVALAAACFAVAQALGGSGFIACFAGGLLFGHIAHDDRHAMLQGAEATGEVLALLTWLIFGSEVISVVLPHAGLTAIAYAVLSLTVIRMAPVFLALRGTRIASREALFIGWFGPRGLASIVFAIMVNDAGLPGNTTLMVTAGCAVVLSVVAHGISANPLIRALFAARGAAVAGDTPLTDTAGTKRP